MLPMLRQKKDLVTIRRYDGSGLHKYDVALFSRPGSDKYVLHRVIEVHENVTHENPAHESSVRKNQVRESAKNPQPGDPSADHTRAADQSLASQRYYTFLGDHCINKEYHIPEQAILGVMTQFSRGGKTISVTAGSYKVYSRVKVFLYPIRKVRMVICRKIRRAAGRIIR